MRDWSWRCPETWHTLDRALLLLLHAADRFHAAHGRFPGARGGYGRPFP